MKPQFEMLAGYNRWANGQLYAAAGELGETDYRADRGAFFRSMHGTLNHILAADRIWMRRFTGRGEAPDRLDAILFEGRGELAQARQAEDERILAYVEGLCESAFEGTFHYRTISNPRDISQPLAPALIHFFNHQTHHRGQAHCLLTQIAGRAPSLDLILFQRETGIGLS